MAAGRIYWGQLVAVLGAIALGAVAATQWTASTLAFQPQLGAPDAHFFGHRLYWPWRLFVWWAKT